MAKTNVVSVNSKKPTSAVALAAMDVITMGRTQLAFIPFCGEDFDWSELGDVKG
jgi:ribosomal protein S12